MGVYTSHGFMTAADMEEYRQDTDWYEQHEQHVPRDDECEHGRPFTDYCDDCGFETAEAEADPNRQSRGLDQVTDDGAGRAS